MSVTVLQDIKEDGTVYIYFPTHDKSGSAVAPNTAFETADFKIYKNGSATQKTTTNGLTIASPFDTITGLHKLEIDTSVDTGDTGFWVPGAHYMVLLDADETVDSEDPLAIWTFGIQNLSLDQFSIYGEVDATSTTTVLETDLSSTTVNFYANTLCVLLSGTLAGQRRPCTASSATGALTCDAFTNSPAIGTRFALL